MSSVWDFLGGAASGGLSFLFNGSDAWDPFHLFTKTDSQKLSEEQWKWQTNWLNKNYVTQDQWKHREYDAAMQELQYQHDLNTMQMQREDDAVRRRVADLQAAGLSPTLAAGSAASATPVHAGNVPSIEAPQHGIADDPRIQAAMFKEGMMKDRMALALTAMGNIADVSRTKAETEFINAQKDKLVQETPVDLRIKEELAKLNEGLTSIKIDQAKKDLSKTEIDMINKLYERQSMADDHLIKTTRAVREELGVKLDEQALRIGKSEESIKQTEALIKAIALKLDEYQLKTEERLQDFYSYLGVPRGIHDKPAYAPYTLMRGFVEVVDKGANWVIDKIDKKLRKK